MRYRKTRIIIVIVVLIALGVVAAGYVYRNYCHTYIAFTGGSITFFGANKEGYIAIVRRDFYGRGRGDIKTLYFGTSGHRSTDVLRDLPAIFAMKPQLVVVFVGANDLLGKYSLEQNGNSLRSYEATLRTIIRKIRERGIDVIVCSPIIVGERDYARPPADTAADRQTNLFSVPRAAGFDPAQADREVGIYAEKAREVAGQMGVPYCDLRKAFKDYLAVHNPENRLEGILTYDGLHPNERGHELIAETLLPYVQRSQSVKDEPLLRRVFRPFTNKSQPVLWKTVSRFDDRIK